MQKGLVTAIIRKASAAETIYHIVNEEDIVQLRSSVVLNVGEEIQFQGNPIQDAAVGDGDVKRYESIVDELVSSSLKKEKGHKINEIEQANKRMHRVLRSSAGLLLKKIAFGAPVIIRFHNDADGGSGAYALYMALKELQERWELAFDPLIIWKMNRSIAYTKESSIEDQYITNNFECLERPLLVIIDFGSTIESNDAIRLVEEKFDIIWLDHHPISDGFSGTALKNYVNAWNFGADSRYTAGAMACTFSKHVSDIDYECMEDASFIGDYSPYMRNSQCGKELSLLLDMLTSDPKICGSTQDSFGPGDIERVMSDGIKRAELLGYANQKMSEALDSALQSVKRYKGNECLVFVADFKNVRNEDSKYPLPGRFASRLLSHIEGLNELPCILALHFGKYISLRSGKKEIDLNEIIKKLREGYGSEIDAGGGHRNAASIKLKNEEDKKDVINALLRELGVAL